MQREWFGKTKWGLTQDLGMWMGIFGILHLIPAWTGSQHSRSYPLWALTTGTSSRIPAKTDPVVERDIWLSAWFMMTFASRVKVNSLKRRNKSKPSQGAGVWLLLLSCIAVEWNGQCHRFNDYSHTLGQRQLYALKSNHQKGGSC